MVVSNNNIPTVLKIRTICHAPDLWKLSGLVKSCIHYARQTAKFARCRLDRWISGLPRSNNNIPTVLKIRTICHAPDLWKLPGLVKSCIHYARQTAKFARCRLDRWISGLPRSFEIRRVERYIVNVFFFFFHLNERIWKHPTGTLISIVLCTLDPHIFPSLLTLH